MSFYNNKIYSGILDALPNHDPELVKLAGLQFMPFEQRELHFENIDPLNPLQSLSVFTDIASILRYRGQSTPNQTAYIVVDSKGREVGDMTWKKLHLRAEKLAQIITREGGLMKGDRVALIYRKTEILEFLVAMFGCFFAGVVAVPINTIHAYTAQTKSIPCLPSLPLLSNTLYDVSSGEISVRHNNTSIMLRNFNRFNPVLSSRTSS
ncbi:12388_t:CDS:2, partial [Entrophospora sp. SA101]